MIYSFIYIDIYVYIYMYFLIHNVYIYIYLVNQMLTFFLVLPTISIFFEISR